MPTEKDCCAVNGVANKITSGLNYTLKRNEDFTMLLDALAEKLESKIHFSQERLDVWVWKCTSNTPVSERPLAVVAENLSTSTEMNYRAYHRLEDLIDLI